MEWSACFSIAAAAYPPIFRGSWRRTRWGVVASSQPGCSIFAVHNELVFEFYNANRPPKGDLVEPHGSTRRP